LTEIPKFSVGDAKSWLERETSSIFVPVQKKAEKLRNETARQLENLTESAKMLSENSGKELEKKNMKTFGRARALNKLARLFMDRIKQVKVPEQVSYDSLNNFVQETQKTLLVIDVDIRNYFPRISPFFIFDRRKFQIVFEKAKESHKDLGEFLSREYVKTKTLEDTFKLIDELKSLDSQLASISEQIENVEDENATVESEIGETKQKETDLANKGGLSQLTQLDGEIEALSREVKSSLRHLQKPFIKLQSLATHGGGSGLTPEELTKLNHYIENPFEALATETETYPLMRQILQKLNRLMLEDKLKLKPEKIRKAQRSTSNIINQNSLMVLHQKCADAKMQKMRLSTSAKLAETRNSLSKLQVVMENLERKKAHVEFDKNAKEKAYGETLEKMRNHKSQIEKNIFDFLEKRVHIE
jgi:hypothetical protein